MSPENRGIAPETLRAVGPLPPMPPLARSAVLVIILMLCFVFLASEMMEGDLARFDTAVLMAFRTAGNDPIGPAWLQETGRDVTALGSFAFLGFLFAATTGYLLLIGKRGLALLMVAAVLGGVVVSWTERSATAVTYRAVRMDVDPTIVATVLVPAETSSTAQTRGLLPEMVPHEDAAFNASRAALMSVALASHPEFLLAATEDRLHQFYRAPALVGTTEWVGRLRDRGLAATVSGAGPTVLVLGTSALPADLRGDAEAQGWQVLDLRIAEGARVLVGE